MDFQLTDIFEIKIAFKTPGIMLHNFPIRYHLSWMLFVHMSIVVVSSGEICSTLIADITSKIDIIAFCFNLLLRGIINHYEIRDFKGLILYNIVHYILYFRIISRYKKLKF